MNTPLVKLGDVCEVVRARIPIAQLTEETYISTDNMLQRRKGVTKVDKLPLKGTAVRFRPGDVLLSNIRPYLQKLWLAEREGGASSDIIVFRPKPECAPAYLFHALSQEAFFDYVMLNPSGTKMPRGRREWIARFAFPLPSLAEQERIVAHLERTLGAIDAMEAKFREMAETAERHFRATLAESFAALSSAPAVKLGEVCEVTYGYAFASEFLNSEAKGCPIIRIQNVLTGITTTYTTEACNPRYLIRKGDLLIGMSGAFNIARWQGAEAFLNQRVCRLAPKLGVLGGYLLYRLPEYLAQIWEAKSFTTLKNLSKQELEGLSFPLPSLAEQERVVARLERAEGVSRRVVALAQEGVAQCGVYRRAVLSEAFGGGVGDE